MFNRTGVSEERFLDNVNKFFVYDLNLTSMHLMPTAYTHLTF